MSLQKLNSDVAVNLLVTGVITDEQYIEAAVQSGVDREQASKDLMALYTQRQQEQVKEQLKDFKDNTLGLFLELGEVIKPNLPTGIEAVKISVEVATAGIKIDKFSVKRTDGERFISLAEAKSGNGSGGNGKIPIPTPIIEVGLDSWVKVAGALHVETDSTQNARLMVKRHGGEKGLALYTLTDEAVKALPGDATLETRQEAVDQAYETSMLTFP